MTQIKTPGKKKNNRFLIYGIGILLIVPYVLFMDNTTFRDKKTSVETCSIIPLPTEYELNEGLLLLGINSFIYFDHPDLKPIASNLARDLHRITGNSISISSEKDKNADIQILFSDSMEKDEYSFIVGKKIILKSGGLEGAHMGSVSLAQISLSHLNKIAFPKISVKDKPVMKYRGLLLDVARQWHSISDIQQVIETCRWYKINYLQLHLTDDQSFTFPSRTFPGLATPGRSYTLEELKKLEEFAFNQGVTIIPELETPGHSSLMRKVEPFGLEGIHVINMLDEKVYEALDHLVGEMCEVFKSTPYFHIGADECWMKGVGETEAEKEFMLKNNLEDHHDIYNYFIVRMNEIVKKHGKKTLVWEGFKGKGSKNVSIPDDITVFAWESLYQRPDSLLNNGYTVINASWQPLYIVPHRSWDQDYIYDWNPWRFENWWEITPAYNTIQVSPTDQIIGAQMCAWENKPEYDIPAIMLRLPAMSDRIWQPSLDKGDFADFQYRYHIQNSKLLKVLYPFKIKIEGLKFPGYIGTDQKKPYEFESGAWIKIEPYRDDIQLFYTTDGTRPSTSSMKIDKDLRFSADTKVTIQAYNEKGQYVGYPLCLPLQKNQE